MQGSGDGDAARREDGEVFMEVGSGQAGEARQHNGWQLSNASENGCHFYWCGRPESTLSVAKAMLVGRAKMKQ